MEKRSDRYGTERVGTFPSAVYVCFKRPAIRAANAMYSLRRLPRPYEQIGRLMT